MNSWHCADRDMALEAGRVLDRLISAGHDAYWVGGCVRDELLGRSIQDMDLTTSAEPDEVVGLFDNVIPTGIQHGTVTVVSGGYSFEVTTFRTESDYEDHRRPQDVRFVKDVREDLRRRDFTMNAMALTRDGELVDPFGGEADIRSRLIRCVGAADERFEEDALRMLRCVRFAAVFGFRIAPSTWKALLRKRHLLRFIAMERVRTEMEKIMKGPDPLRGLELLRRSALLFSTKAATPWERINARSLERLNELPEPQRWELLLLSGGFEPEEADAMLRDWTFSNAFRIRMLRLLEWDKAVAVVPPSASDEADLRRLWISWLLQWGKESAADWLAVNGVLPPDFRQDAASRRVADVLEANGSEWTDQTPIEHMKDLNITGNDLLAELNRRGGPWLGKLMEHLLLAAACGDIPNVKERLIEEAKRVTEVEEA
ncbi:CCA tRNA nucleotidyltransferase [Paenibacillus jiagnxiensis]|uniref:CCA tRNA nucleotidyltransferase n=1 Tax=Paenibacillus jiagnxiensis TaxID=3228926 RepID=UPI0033B65156